MELDSTFQSAERHEEMHSRKREEMNRCETKVINKILKSSRKRAAVKSKKRRKAVKTKNYAVVKDKEMKDCD